MCLGTDGWSNVHNDSVVTYTGSNSENSIFLQSVNTREISHSGVWISDDINRVMKELYEDGITSVGCCTDNTSANKLAWERLGKNYPNKLFYECACHWLHLFVKDIVSPTKAVMKTWENVIPPHPFLETHRTVALVMILIKFFFNHHVAKATLENQVIDAGKSKLVRPAPTRWGAIYDSLVSVANLLDVELLSAVSSRDFVSGQKSPAAKESAQIVYDFVRDPETKEAICKTISLLAPIMVEIKKFQSDRVPVSQVFVTFCKLRIEMTRMAFLSGAQRDFLSNIVQDRWDLLYSDCHGMAYMLDPVCYNSPEYEEYINHEADLKADIEKWIYAIPMSNNAGPRETLSNDVVPYTETTPAVKRLQFRELMKFQALCRRMKDDATPLYLELTDGTMSPVDFWNINAREFPYLAPIAISLFNLSSSSASAERSFSAMGFIQNKLRNCLKPEKVEKLTYIKMNWRIAHAIDAPLDSDDEYEEQREYGC